MTEGRSAKAAPTIEAYRGPRWLRGAHLQTIVPALWPSGPKAPVSRKLIAEVDEANRLEVLLSRPAPGVPTRGTLLLVHGLAGSASSRHPVETASEATARGWHVARVNLRNCGSTARLTSTLFNATQSEDIEAVLRLLEEQSLPRPFAVLGFSLGGSTVLRYAGLSGDGCAADAVAALNAPIDLHASARVIERPDNLLYQLTYTQGLCDLLNEARDVRDLEVPEARWWRIRSIRRFDALYTVPDGGFANVDDYYNEASASAQLSSIRRPGLIVASRNDPVVPIETYEGHSRGNPHLRFEHPTAGGHLGYWTGRRRFWASSATLDWFERTLEGRATA